MLALAGALVAGLLVTGCAGDDGSEPGAEPTSATGTRPVTADEADRLAVSRFRNYERERVAFEVDVATTAGATFTMTGRADMRAHRAIASVTQADPAAYAVFAWNLASVAVVETGAAATDAELTNAVDVPADRWQVRPLEEQQPVDQVLRVLLNLALDRPDNAQLLRQNGAQWQASTTVDGRKVDVMTATPADQGRTLTYYVASDDGTLVRVDVAGDFARPATITFLPTAPDDVAAVPRITALGAEPTATTSPQPIG